MAERRREKTVRDLIPSDVLVRPLQATTKEEAIAELLNALVIDGVLDLSREASVRDLLLEREKVASTGIGNGMAIPHAKNKFAERLGVAVGISDDGIDFAAHDGQYAHVVVLWICPPKETQAHLALMRALASVAQEEKVMWRLAGCKDKRSFLGILEEIPAEKK
jgi:mannitol/fructose-specific phosphotransferase system IIA component (Ntr-type)